MEQNLFKVDYGKLQYRIGIDVVENGSIFYVFDLADGFELNYQHVIGVIETLKNNIIQQQAAANRQSETRKSDLQKAEAEFKESLQKFKHPNDCLVRDSDLPTGIKTAIDKHIEDEGKVFNKPFDELMLSDLIKISKYDWRKVRNIGDKAIGVINDCLVKKGMK